MDDLSQPLVLGGKNKIIDPKGLMSITSSSKKKYFMHRFFINILSVL